MNQLNYCFECSYRCKLPKPLPKSLIAIQKSNCKINPQFQRLIDQLIDQKYHDL